MTDRDLIELNSLSELTTYRHVASKRFLLFRKLRKFSWAELKDLMRKAGEVTYVDAHTRSGRGNWKLFKNRKYKTHQGRGEACFATRDELYRAFEDLQGMKVYDRAVKLHVKEDGDKDVRRSR